MTSESISPDDIPFDIKERLLGISKMFPSAKQGAEFIKQVTPKICGFIWTELKHHPRAAVYGFVAYYLTYGIMEYVKEEVPGGCIIDWAIPDGCEGLAQIMAGLLGAGYGFVRDREVATLRSIIVKTVRDVAKP
ncbi:hypothetical protein FACS189419_03630 [Planctomycetales bacterium]|nr:hypothetical protein FACS189419_03630 [Planctomycetales bacterium]